MGNERAFQLANLLIQQVTGYSNQAYDDIRGNHGIRMFNTSAKSLVIGTANSVQLAHSPSIWMVMFPLLRTAQTKKIEIVVEQFLQTGAGDIG
jgi:hypothetical protein